MALPLPFGRGPAVLVVSLAVAALSACSREPAGAESARGGNATVGTAAPANTASTPMPVSPQGLTNSSTAANAQDLTNSTSARGNTNLPQPPSADNPASGPGVGGTGSPMGTPSQTTTSQSLGTNPGAASSTAPSGVTGGSGKSGTGKL